MKAYRNLALPALLAATVAFGAAQAMEHPKTEHPAQAEHPATAGHAEGAVDLVAAAAAAGNLTTFVAAVKAAGLAEELQGKGPFTVFAPTDEAFAKLPAGQLDDLLKPANKAQLAGILAYHVVPGRLMAADIVTMKATNVAGRDLGIASVGDGLVLVDDAKVVKTDIVAANGVIHAVDAVIMPAAAVEHPASDKPKDHPAH